MLRTFDVGSPLSRLTFPVPVTLEGKAWDDLLAVAADGALVLIGGLPSAPRVLSRVDAHALPDARITLGSLDGSAGLRPWSSRTQPSAIHTAPSATSWRPRR